MYTQINIHLQWEEARSSMLSQHIYFGEVDLESEGGHTNRKGWKSAPPPPPWICTRRVQKKKKDDVCQSAVFEGIQKESKEAMKGTMGGLWASTLLLHQYALRVQTDGVLGSLCWCNSSTPLPPFTVDNKDLRLHHNNFWMSLFQLHLMFPRLQLAAVSAHPINCTESTVLRQSTLTNWVSCKCQQLWSRSIALVVNSACWQLYTFFFLPTNTISSIKATVFLIESWELYLSFYDSLASATRHTQRKAFLEQYDYRERGWEYAHS